MPGVQSALAAAACQVVVVEGLGLLYRGLVPPFPVSALVAGDEHDRLPPRVEREQDPDLRSPGRAGPKLLQVLEPRALDGIDQRAAEGGPVVGKHADRGADEPGGLLIVCGELGEPVAEAPADSTMLSEHFTCCKRLPHESVPRAALFAPLRRRCQVTQVTTVTNGAVETLSS